MVLIPKSSNKQRMKENIDIFDFDLNEEDVAVLETFDTGDRTISPFYKDAKTSDHKYFPKNIEF